MSVNMFGKHLESAHAGMTAEGDNSVLMQKVCKEQLGKFKPLKMEKPKSLDFHDLDHLIYLLDARYNQNFMAMAMMMGKAAVYNKVGRKVPSFMKDYFMEKGRLYFC